MTPRKLLIFFVVLLTACCPLGENCLPVRRIKESSQLRREIVASQGWYPPGSTIKLTYSVQNITEKPLTFYRADGPVIDIVYLYDKTQRWSASVDAAVDIHTLTLQPGETRTLEWEFTAQNDGLYDFDGTIWLWEDEYEIPIGVNVGRVQH